MRQQTTAFVPGHAKSYIHYDSCHGGVGPFQLRDLIMESPRKQFIRYIHDDIVPPGSSFGEHSHISDAPFEEWYLCLDGEGIMTLDDKDYPFKPGDTTVCFAGGRHGVRNTGSQDLRLLVIAVGPPPAETSK